MPESLRKKKTIAPDDEELYLDTKYSELTNECVSFRNKKKILKSGSNCVVKETKEVLSVPARRIRARACAHRLLGRLKRF